MPQDEPPLTPRRRGPGTREFVAMMAMLMALNALAIDSMLPALPEMAQGLGARGGNAQQAVITSYFYGLGLGSLLHGPLSDRFGRRSVILFALAGYVVCGVATGLASSWAALLSLRFAHGLFGAALGVVATAIVRDRTSGDDMARLLSVIFLVFMVVPILAPSVGQAVLAVADWRAIFALLAVMGTGMALWVVVRLPETLDPADVVPMQLMPMLASWRSVATHRQALAYMLGSALAVGANFGFLNSAQQIISETFDRGDIFAQLFACVAGGIAVANYSNARLVLLFGARRVSQAALLSFIALSVAQWWMATAGETLTAFLIILTLNMGMIGFIGANFSSIAMQPFGHIAGTASSFQNSVRTFVSAGVGAVIGGAYDGTTGPLAQGYVVCGIAALLLILWGEGGRLFTRPNPPHLPTPRA